MAESIKFTAEELDKIKELRDKNQVKVQEFGRVEIELIIGKQTWDNLVKEKKKIETEYEQIQKEEKDLVEELNKKYGAGTVDLSSGEFTPSN